MKIHCRRLAGFLLLAPGWHACLAADSNTVSPGAGLLQIAFGLLVVLGVMAFAAWAFKRLGPVASGNKLALKMVGGLNVGNRERVMVVEVADQWLVLGVTASNITTLATLPKQEHLLPQTENQQAAAPFSDWLKRTLERRTPAGPETK